LGNRWYVNARQRCLLVDSVGLVELSEATLDTVEVLTKIDHVMLDRAYLIGDARHLRRQSVDAAQHFRQ
jgi:hypothetical protein